MKKTMKLLPSLVCLTVVVLGLMAPASAAYVTTMYAPVMDLLIRFINL